MRTVINIFQFHKKCSSQSLGTRSVQSIDPKNSLNQWFSTGSTSGPSRMTKIRTEVDKFLVKFCIIHRLLINKPKERRYDILNSIMVIVTD